MNLAAQQLVAEDARASRGMEPVDQLVEESRELDDLLEEDRRHSTESKGKGRAAPSYHDSPSLPFPPSTSTDSPHDHVGSSSSSRFFAFGERGRRRSMLGGHGGKGGERRERERRSRAYWQNAAINLAFIASWSACASLSPSSCSGRCTGISSRRSYPSTTSTHSRKDGALPCKLNENAQMDVLSRSLQFWFPSLRH